MLCYRCGGHVKDGSEKCDSCGQTFALGMRPGPIAGFGTGSRRHRVAIEGTPYKAGDSIARRYRIKDHLGAGPVGWVYRATDTETDTDVGLKILSPRFLQMAEEKKAFFAEMHKAKALAHPNLVRVYDFGEDGDRPFVATQLLEGLSLRRIMDLRRQKSQGFTLQEVEPIVAQIAAALEAAGPAFAHGDLKPDNVIVLPDLLKLTDFGLAVSLPRAPFMAAQKAGGVHRYLAPEFLLGERLDARTDVYGLGVMLAEMLAGAQWEPLLDVNARNPSLPQGIGELVRRAVAPKAHERFSTAADLADELTDLLERGELPTPTSTTRPGTPRPAALPMAAGGTGLSPALAPAQPPPSTMSASQQASANAAAAAAVMDSSDVEEVVIEEIHTDPRVRIARALAEQDKEIRAAAVERKSAASSAGSAAVQLPGTLQTHMAEPVAQASVAAVAKGTDMAEVAKRVGATPEMLTAETAVKAAPTAPPAKLAADAAAQVEAAAQAARIDAAFEEKLAAAEKIAAAAKASQVAAAAEPVVAARPAEVPAAAVVHSAITQPGIAVASLAAANQAAAPQAPEDAPTIASAIVDDSASNEADSDLEATGEQQPGVSRPKRGRGKGKAERRNGRKAPREGRDPAWTQASVTPPPPVVHPENLTAAQATVGALAEAGPAVEARSSAVAASPAPSAAAPTFGRLVEKKRKLSLPLIAVLALAAIIAVAAAVSLARGGGSSEGAPTASEEPKDPKSGDAKDAKAAAAKLAGKDEASAKDVKPQVPAAGADTAVARPAGSTPVNAKAVEPVKAEPLQAAPAPEAPAPKADLEDRGTRRREQKRARAAADARKRSLTARMSARRDARTSKDKGAAAKPASDDDERGAAREQAVALAASRRETSAVTPATSAPAAAPTTRVARPASTPTAAAPAATPAAAAAEEKSAPAGEAAAQRMALIPAMATKPPGGIPGLDDGELLPTKTRPALVPPKPPAQVAMAIPAVAVVSGAGCPSGMARIPAGRALVGSDPKDDLRNFGDRNLTNVEVGAFCIDKYEFPNQVGKLPRVGVSFGEAESLCQGQGKRLCAEEEWEKACKGPEATRFPYGGDFDAEACNTQDAKDQPRQISALGAFARCRSGYGVFDLSGNAAEWTSSPFGGEGAEKTVKGGSAARPAFDDRCASRRKAKPGLHDVKVGFRCCQ